MIQLGSLVLRNGLVWDEEFTYTGILQEMKVTLGGTPVIFTVPTLGPVEITLRSQDDEAWQTYAHIKELYSMAKELDGSFPLILGDKSFTVRFRHYAPPVIEAKPLIPKTTYLDTDYFLLTLKLISFP